MGGMGGIRDRRNLRAIKIATGLQRLPPSAENGSHLRFARMRMSVADTHLHVYNFSPRRSAFEVKLRPPR